MCFIHVYVGYYLLMIAHRYNVTQLVYRHVGYFVLNCFVIAFDASPSTPPRLQLLALLFLTLNAVRLTVSGLQQYTDYNDTMVCMWICTSQISLLHSSLFTLLLFYLKYMVATILNARQLLILSIPVGVDRTHHTF